MTVFGENFPLQGSGQRDRGYELSMDTNNKIYQDVFYPNSPRPLETPRPLNVTAGAITEMRLPPGWVEGQGNDNGTRYSRSFHPGGQSQRDDVQMVVSYRGHRATANTSAELKTLLNSAPADGSPRALKTADLQAAPWNEVLGDHGSRDAFQIISAKVQRCNGEPALIIEGKYAKHDVNAKIMYVDASRTDTTRGSTIQEVALIAPTKEFYKFALQTSDVFRSIQWRK